MPNCHNTCHSRQLFTNSSRQICLHFHSPPHHPQNLPLLSQLSPAVRRGWRYVSRHALAPASATTFSQCVSFDVDLSPHSPHECGTKLRAENRATHPNPTMDPTLAEVARHASRNNHRDMLPCCTQMMCVQRASPIGRRAVSLQSIGATGARLQHKAGSGLCRRES